MQYARLTISFLFALCVFVLPQTVGAAAYYVDFECGTGGVHPACSTLGTATTTPFSSLDAFTEAARSAGDIVFVRRNTASTTAPSDLDFTSDGTILNPLIISADNDNLWNDASTTAQTYTVAAATSTFTASATITGLQVGDWFYVVGDCTQTYNTVTLNPCKYFYEVASISGTQLTLYVPYKGDQSGSGLSLVNMGKNPQWHTATQDFQWNFDTDDYWIVKGIDVRGTDPNGNIEVDSSEATVLEDMILVGDGTTSLGVNMTDDDFAINIYKMRAAGPYSGAAIGSIVADIYGYVAVYDSLLFPASGNTGIVCPANSLGSGICIVKDTKVFPESRVMFGGMGNGGISYGINTNASPRNLTSVTGKMFLSDSPSKGENSFTLTGLVKADTYLSSSTQNVVRSGGGPVSSQIQPSTDVNGKWEFASIKIFEYPIYTNTSSKTYDVYFMSTSTSAWTTDPTASELWVECEYWAHNTGATSTRKVKKSTGVVDFNGSTSWQSLSVTCQPTQTGIMYLRGWYTKTKESGKMNEFYVDGTPVIN